jgi:N-dimethylarginine dimethylaminohydrolase
LSVSQIGSTKRFRSLKEYNICEVAHKENALKQHHRLRATLRNFGSEVIDVPELKTTQILLSDKMLAFG